MFQRNVETLCANRYDVTVTLEITDLDTGAAQTILSNTIQPVFAVPATAGMTRVSDEGLSDGL